MTNPAIVEAHDLHCTLCDDLMPGWQDDEARAEGLVLGERDFPLTEDTEGVSDEDWSAFLEMTWCDPAERALD